MATVFFDPFQDQGQQEIKNAFDPEPPLFFKKNDCIESDVGCMLMREWVVCVDGVLACLLASLLGLGSTIKPR